MDSWNLGLRVLVVAIAVATSAGAAGAAPDTIYIDTAVQTPLGEQDVSFLPIPIPRTHLVFDGLINNGPLNNKDTAYTIQITESGEDAAVTLYLLPDAGIVIPKGAALWQDPSQIASNVEERTEIPLTGDGALSKSGLGGQEVRYSTPLVQAGGADLAVGVKTEDVLINHEQLHEESARTGVSIGSRTDTGDAERTGYTVGAAGSPAFLVPASPSTGEAGFTGSRILRGTPEGGVFYPVDTGHEAGVASLSPQSGLTTDAGMPRASQMDVLAGAAAIGLLLMAPWLLYHRIKGSKTLENGARKAIYDAIADNPGIGVQGAADAARVSYSTASYHLDRLVKARMIVQSDEGGKLRYYKTGAGVSETDRKLVPLMQSPEAMRVLEAITASPGTYRAALADRLGVSVTALNWHLKRLLDARLVNEVREGRSARLFADATLIRGNLGSLAEKLGAPQQGVLAAADGDDADDVAAVA